MKRAHPLPRIMAFLLDWLIVFTIVGFISINPILMSFEVAKSPTTQNILSLTVTSLLTGGMAFVFITLYFLVVPVLSKGQTVGKKFFRIRIVKNDGSNVDFAALFIREVIGKILIDFSTFGLSVFASGAVLCLQNERVTFHDILSSTMVVDVE